MSANPFSPLPAYSPEDGFNTGQTNSPVDSGALFNERGYNKSNSVAIDSEEMISDYNGSLFFNVPLYNLKGPGDLKMDLSLTYSSNIGHTMISSDESYFDSLIGYCQYNYGSPQWILNLNGIGVQTLSFETNLYTKRTSSGNAYTQDEKVRHLMNGYHLTGEMEIIEGSLSDKIYLLQGDGSVDTLMNLAMGSTKDYYKSQGRGVFSRGKVEFINPSSTDKYDLRRLYYLKGDGLIYMYEEARNFYSDFPNPAPSFQKQKNPKSFLLKSIKDRFGNTLDLEYTSKPGRSLLTKIKCDWEPFAEIDLTYSVTTDLTPKITISNSSTEYPTTTYEVGLEQKIEYGQYDNHVSRITSIKNPVNQTMSFEYEDIYERKIINMHYGLRTNSVPYPLSQVKLNTLKRIKSMVNYVGGKTEYLYIDYIDELFNYGVGEGGDPRKPQSATDANYRGPGRDLFFVNMVAQKLYKNISNQTFKKETFEYTYTNHYNGTYPWPNQGVPMGDRFTNPIHELNDLITTKITESVDDTNLFETPKKIKVTRLFRSYKTHGYQFNFFNKDFSSEILEVHCEQTTWNSINNSWNPSNYYTKNNEYRLGTPTGLQQWGLFFKIGSFLVSKTKENYIDGGENIIEFDYEHYVYDDNTSWFAPGPIDDNPNPVKQITTKYKDGTKEIKKYMFLFRVYQITGFPNSEFPYSNGHYNPTSGASQDYDDKNKLFYMTNMIQSELLWGKNRTNVDQYFINKSYYYKAITDNECYIGQLMATALSDSPGNPNIITYYKYARNYILGRDLYYPQYKMPSIEGNLIKVISPNNSIKNLYYHPVDEPQTELEESSPQEETVPYLFPKLALVNGAILTYSEHFQDRRLPTRIDVFPNGETGSDAYSLKKYQLYDVSGNITQSISNNNFLSTFDFDNIQRILRITTPYDFSSTNPLNDPSKFTNKYIYNDSSRISTTLAKIDSATEKKTEHYFDEFYKKIKSRHFTSSTLYNDFLTFYNYLDEKSKTADGMNYVTKFSYDPLGNLKLTELQDGNTQINETYYIQGLPNYGGVALYDLFIKKVVFYDEERNKIERYFDIFNNLRREIKFIPNDRESEEPVMVDGNVVESIAPLKALQTDYYYEAKNRLTKIVTPAGKIIYNYYDKYGRVIQTITPDSGTTNFLYDNDSNLIYSQSEKQRLNPDNPYTFYSYDKANRILGTGQAGMPMDGYPEFSNINPEEKYFFNNVNSSLDSPSNLNEYLIYNVYDKLENSVSGFLTPPDDYNDVENYTLGQIACIAFRTRVTDTWNFKYFRYDARGRVKRMWLILDDIGLNIFDFEYNSLNQITYVNVNPHNHGRKFQYSYDMLGRLRGTNLEESGIPPDYFTNLVTYSYNANSLITNTSLSNAAFSYTNSFDNRNRITEMDVAGKLFKYNLEYYKNSNVKKQIISGEYQDNFSSNKDIGFEFLYDTANRLKETKKLIGDYENAGIINTYDLDGNLLKMVRAYNGDNFSYEYYSRTNKLMKVSGTEAQFDYDKNGNLLNDRLMKNYFMLYDYRNLLIEVKSGEPGDPPSFYYTRYWYDEAGNRIKKLVLNSLTIEPPYPNWNDPTATGDWGIYEMVHYVRDNAGKSYVEYKNTDLDFYNIWGVDLVGKVKNDGSKYYYYKDHLGSIRATINDLNQMISAVDYDSWGNIIREWQTEETKYKFSSKERDFENTYDYFGARNFSSRIGRWIQIDPKFSKHYDFTPYNYVLNNPLTLIDPDGRQEKNSTTQPQNDDSSSVNIDFHLKQSGRLFAKWEEYWREQFSEKIIEEKFLEDMNYLKAQEKEVNNVGKVMGFVGKLFGYGAKGVSAFGRGLFLNLFISPSYLGEGSYQNGKLEYDQQMRQNARIKEAEEISKREEARAKSIKAKSTLGSEKLPPF